MEKFNKIYVSFILCNIVRNLSTLLMAFTPILISTEYKMLCMETPQSRLCKFAFHKCFHVFTGDFAKNDFCRLAKTANLRWTSWGKCWKRFSPKTASIWLIVSRRTAGPCVSFRKILKNLQTGSKSTFQIEKLCFVQLKKPTSQRRTTRLGSHSLLACLRLCTR